MITASGFAQQIADAPATVTVIDAADLEGRSYSNITDVLQDTPGLSIENSGKTNAPTITMRGLGEAYVLLLVDGKPLGATEEAFYNGWGSGQKTALLPPAAAIERIEIIRGPMSSLYGSAASGGVINVITKPVADFWTGSMTVEGALPEDGATGASSQGRFYLSGPLIEDVLGLSLTGSVYDRDADDILNGYPETLRKTLGARLNWNISDAQDLAFEMNRVDQEYENSVETTGADGQVSSENTSYGLNHRLSWGEGYETRSFATHEVIDILNDDLVSSYSMTNLNSRTTMVFGDHHVVLGFDYREEQTDHDRARFLGSVNSDLRRWHYALFAEDEWAITEDFALTIGGRLDRNENYGTNFTPRIYGVYHLNDALTLKGGISAGYKVPALKQADSNIVEPAGRGAGWDRGNTDLQPEESTNYELGLIWDGSRGIQVGATVYHTKFDNKIDREFICESPGETPICFYNGEARQWIREYVNRDSAELNGLELTLDAPLAENFDISANYTWQDSEITSGEGAGDPLNYLPRHMLNLRLDWQATDQATIWSSARYKSETQEGVETEATPGYTLVDLGTTYRFNDRVQGFAQIENVFDRQVESEAFGKVLDGRTLRLGLETTF
ncbi:TonB-dependent receptor [Paracoccus sp. TK19116]|uniref:TonB-dependent receptor n=1 Tax=Paracoccus albicereus TaxID=2922394 RepID=A0ABT1MUJ9_9RHOB|nr:TonB-dependent receptor [Paracoccus albicereus]MCQ0971957.1 TonB-dependent receptor [Paracoccus albicereus]